MFKSQAIGPSRALVRPPSYSCHCQYRPIARQVAALRPLVAENTARIAMTQHIEHRRRSASSGLPALLARALGLLAVTMLAAPLAATQAQAQAQPDKVVAKVSGIEIRESDLTMAEEDMGQQAQQLQGDAKRDALVGYLADVIIVSKAAEAKKVTEQKEFKSRIAFIRNKLAMEMVLVEEGKAATTDAAMRKVYDEAVEKSGPQEEGPAPQ